MASKVALKGKTESNTMEMDFKGALKREDGELYGGCIGGRRVMMRGDDERRVIRV